MAPKVFVEWETLPIPSPTVSALWTRRPQPNTELLLAGWADNGNLWIYQLWFLFILPFKKSIVNVKYFSMAVIFITLRTRISITNSLSWNISPEYIFRLCQFGCLFNFNWNHDGMRIIIKKITLYSLKEPENSSDSFFLKKNTWIRILTII